jgi:glutamate-5-semialdehyde dehydrogenase
LESLLVSENNAIFRATQAANDLRNASSQQRTATIVAMARALHQEQDAILEANTLDLETSREMAISHRLLEWLKLTPERLEKIVNDLNTLSRLPDPVGRIVATSKTSIHGQTFTELLPLGVIAFVHESLPDLAALAAGLCLRSGNSLLLRGSQEARQTNRAIVQVLQSAIVSHDLPSDCLIDLAVEEDYSLRDLFNEAHPAQLVIPYGRPSWVEQVVRQCNAPILQTAIGNCYLYWAASGSLDTVRSAIIDSHLTQPDAVNGIEKVLVSGQVKPSSLGMLWNSLREKGFEIRGDADLCAEFPDLKLAETSEWSQSYLQKTVAFKAVDRLEAATDWINQYSSGHADSIITDSYTESQQFTQRLHSTFIYINASPRFYRLDPGGHQVFLGITKQKGMRRGTIGVESLMTTKQVIQGMRA